MKANDLLKYPETAYIKLPSEKYVAEQELAEKYRAVVSEILRLSLAGFGVFTPFGIDARTPECIRILVVLALFCFAASAGLAVWFLYGASEGLRWYIAGLRYSEMSDEAVRPPEAKEISLPWGRPGAKAMLEKRDKIVRWCFYSKSSAAVLLIAGVIFIGVATVSKMWSPPPAPVAQAPPTHPQL